MWVSFMCFYVLIDRLRNQSLQLEDASNCYNSSQLFRISETHAVNCTCTFIIKCLVISNEVLIKSHSFFVLGFLGGLFLCCFLFF